MNFRDPQIQIHSSIFLHIICVVLLASGQYYFTRAITCYLPSCGFYGPYTMDRNNYIEIHPTQAQVAKISYRHPSKYINRNVSPQLQYLVFRIMCLFSEQWVCKQVLNDHNFLCSLQCKKPFDLLVIMSNHR